MSGSSNKKIAHNFLWIAIFLLIAKMIGALKEVVLAWRYGISNIMDAYLFSQTFLMWLPSVVTSLFITVITPITMALSNEDKESRHLYFSELTGLTLIFSILSALVTLLLSFIPGVIPQKLVIFAPMFFWYLSPIVGFQLFSGLILARLLANERFASSLLEALPAVGLIFAALVFASDLQALLWGSLLGSAMQLLVSLFYAREVGVVSRPVISLNSVHWPAFSAAVGTLFIGQALMSLVSLIDQYMLTGLGVGAIATFGYSNRILGLVLTLGATAISRSILPIMSQIVHARNISHANDLTARWCVILLLIGSALAGAGAVFAQPAVSLLYERGAFTSADTQATAQILRAGLVQVPIYFAGMVLVQRLASAQKYFLIGVGAIINLFVKYVANIILTPLYGVAGVMLATAIMYTASLIFLMTCIFALRRA